MRRAILVLLLAVAGVVLELGERGAHEARDPVLGDQAADLLGGQAGEQHVARGDALGQGAPAPAGQQQRASQGGAERGGQRGVAAQGVVLVAVVGHALGLPRTRSP